MSQQRNKTIGLYRGYAFKGFFGKMGEETDTLIGLSSDYSCGPNSSFPMGWRCSNSIRNGIQREPSSGLCALWYRLDRNSCNHCSGCIFRESFEE